jgi:hypothetical protein
MRFRTDCTWEARQMFDLQLIQLAACLTLALSTDPLLRASQRADAERTMNAAPGTGSAV